MRRRLILVGVFAVSLAACGESAGPSPASSSAASAGPSSVAGASAPAASQTATSEASTEIAAGDTVTAACDGIGLRKSASGSAGRIASLNSGTAVHVAAVVDGTPFTAGSCGTSGSTWLKIDKVGGRTAKAAYGVPFVYAAAGFFQ